MPKKLLGAAWAATGKKSKAIAARAQAAASAANPVAIEALLILILISSAQPQRGGEVAVVGGRAL
jgi:hypothetical protein